MRGESRLWSVLLGGFGFAFVAFAVALVVVARGDASGVVPPDAASTTMIEAALLDASAAEDASAEQSALDAASAAPDASVDAQDASVEAPAPSAVPIVATPKVTHTKAKTRSRPRVHRR